MSRPGPRAAPAVNCALCFRPRPPWWTRPAKPLPEARNDKPRPCSSPRYRSGRFASRLHVTPMMPTSENLVLGWQSNGMAVAVPPAGASRIRGSVPVVLNPRCTQPRQAVAFDGALPRQELVDGELVALARLIEAQQAAAHRR